MPLAARPRCALPLSVSRLIKCFARLLISRAYCCRVNICGIAAGGEQYVLQRDVEYGAEAIFVKSAYALVDALPQVALLLNSQPLPTP
jgi:hypothetical protein